MRVTVLFRQDVDDDERRAIAKVLGKDGLASRTDVKYFLTYQGRVGLFMAMHPRTLFRSPRRRK